MAIEDDDVQVLRIGRNNLVRVLGLGDCAHTGAGEGWGVKADEGLLDTGSLGLIQPRLQLGHLCVVSRARSVPRRWRAIVVFAGPKKDEANAAEIELIDEPLIGNPELL